MNRKRILAIGKLVLLFGGPVAIVVGLFSCGVYCGASHREGLLSFERDWLGIGDGTDDDASDDDEDDKSDDKSDDDKSGDDKSDDDKSDDDKSDDDKSEDDKSEDDKSEDDKSNDDESNDDEGDEAEKAEEAEKADVEDAQAGEADGPTPVAGTPAPTATQAPGVTPPVGPTPTEPLATKTPDPLASDLERKLAVPVTVKVKVLVDQAVIDEQPDWIDYVQRTIAEASLVYREQFGVQLELVAVARWPVATAGMDSKELLAEVVASPRESADIVVGFTARPFDGHISGTAMTPPLDGPFNGAHAVVYAQPRATRPHLRTLLHEVAHLFGARDIVDRESPDWARRSWMSYAPVTDREAPWIDANNRQRILERKELPFEPEGAAAPEKSDEG